MIETTRRNFLIGAAALIAAPAIIRPGLLMPIKPTLVSPGVHNIVHYGAIGDGVTDSTAAIRAAIAVAQEDGGSVFVPDGSFVWRMHRTFELPKAMIWGPGAEVKVRLSARDVAV